MRGRAWRHANGHDVAAESELASLFFWACLPVESNADRLADLAAAVDHEALANVLIEQRGSPSQVVFLQR